MPQTSQDGSRLAGQGTGGSHGSPRGL